MKLLIDKTTSLSEYILLQMSQMSNACNFLCI